MIKITKKEAQKVTGSGTDSEKPVLNTNGTVKFYSNGTVKF